MGHTIDSNILGRRSVYSAEVPPSSEQGRINQSLSSFVSGLSDPYTLAGLLAGNLVARSVQSLCFPFLNSLRGSALGMRSAWMAASALKFAAEVSAYELTQRSLRVKWGGSSLELLEWQGLQGLQKGLLHAGINFATLQGFGKIAPGENIVLQHTLQSTAMVLGNQVAGLLAIIPRPFESFPEQFAQAESLNIQMMGSGALLQMGLGTLSLSDLYSDQALRAQPSRSEMFLSPALASPYPLDFSPLNSMHPSTVFMSAKDLKGAKRGPRTTEVVIEEAGAFQAYHTFMKKSVPELVCTFAYLYAEGFHRPLIGFDPEFVAKIGEARAMIGTLQRHLTLMKNSNVFPLALRNYERALEILAKIPDRFETEARKHGMTPRLAEELHEKILAAAAALGPLGNTLLDSLAIQAAPPSALPLTSAKAKRSQVIGALLGGAIGDAFGAPFEGMSAAKIREKNERQVLPKRITDDTLTNLAVLDAVLESRAVVPRVISSHLERLAPQITSRGFGLATKGSIKRIERGRGWQNSGDHESSGNGAAMRVSSIAILNYRDLNSLRQAIVLSSQITHSNYEAIAGALGVGFILAKILRGEFDPSTLLHETRVFVGPGRFSSQLLEVDQWLSEPSFSSSEVIANLGTSGAVWESVPSAIYAFLASPKNFERTLTTLIQTGGDTDTMASIAGSFLGAYNGLEAIPPPWVEAVERSKEIQEKADQLFSLVHP